MIMCTSKVDEIHSKISLERISRYCRMAYEGTYSQKGQREEQYGNDGELFHCLVLASTVFIEYQVNHITGRVRHLA